MHRAHKLGLCLICALTISGCASTGQAVSPPECPQPPSPPASLMTEPTTEQQVRAELFEPQQSAMPRSEDSNE